MSIDDVIEAGERLPGMAALWHVATVEERREMVMLILEPGGLHYDVETHEIAAITPRPVFLPVLRLLAGVTEYEEATGTLVTRRWQQRNRRESDYLQEGQRDSQTHPFRTYFQLYYRECNAIVPPCSSKTNGSCDSVPAASQPPLFSISMPSPCAVAFPHGVPLRPIRNRSGMLRRTPS